ncbi:MULTISPECIES: hypothetical protein [Streptomyces]|uniref:Lipoprotein n=1 Tax=Streptomyces alboflavus TaxID=67267 RepID=A0A1Z1WHU5_9ACTN|nr:hypothetical protein [Streptomyces alboflavus]ARX86011.1 hypothetical protein SMD44_05480 [Streptomyces alboflavus]
MLYRKNLLRFGVPAVTLALALTACGGDDGGSKKSNSKSKDEAPAAGSHAKDKPAEGKPTGGGALRAGKSATGKVKEGATPVTYEVLAQKVDVGTEADTQKLVRDPKKAKGLVPAVAHLKFTHKGGGVVKETPDAADTTEIWADGRRGGLVIGASEDAPGCDDPLDIEGWKQGESHVLCETYLVPKGSKGLEVHWAEKEDGEPYVWKFAGK